ncbi:MAG: PVC-type heme-binding CxxCH protein [Planctomycetaceae bacterium]
MSQKSLMAIIRQLVALSCMVAVHDSTVLGQSLTASSDAAVSLFDGKSLDGWEGDPEHWRVNNGVIVGEILKGQSLNKNTWLVWRGGELTDFDLRLQFRLTGLPAANSGIQFRCQVENVDHVSGYQADLDMGTTWLGRIYDEHGRALLVERGSRVQILPNGERQMESFAPANQYAVLFRENDWNDYRIVAVGDYVAVYVNGTLFSELQDQQDGEQDLQGSLAFQLHSGPETRIEFREIELEQLKADDARLGKFLIKPQTQPDEKNAGIVPADTTGKPLNLGFESGDLTHWTATGDAFSRQPVDQDGIAQRWVGQDGNKIGDYFIGGYEVVQDRGVGTLTSVPFKVTHPFGSFLFGGGEAPSTRVDLIQINDDGKEEAVIFTAVGANREQMRRVAVDLSKFQGKSVAVRLVDENPGAWGHLNFDDFRFHDEPPVSVEHASAWRSTQNPLLQHLIPTHEVADPARHGSETVAQMFVPERFSVDVIAAEPELYQPMAFTFDARGRLWVVEGHSYPQKRPIGEGLDRILIFADTDHDGTFETRTVFIEGLNLVSGMEVGHGGVWVGAAPELLFIPDRNGDDKPDSEPQVQLDGFGFADTHETLNSFMWGPDGWLYGNQGVFNSAMIGKPDVPHDQRTYLSAGVWRYHPTKHTFEVFAHGGSNQWGLDYDDIGQVFMTHCRSFWGKGPTTHVMQGGHYWNQVNSGHAPFISTQSLPNRPWMTNYQLASARYDHGEGGAGKPGSEIVYGGHSHVGTMIYMGGNWPSEYRNRLFTHNLHGHQINQQINLREAGGFNTVHAGSDVLFCADQQYIGIDLQYGPDGAVYISDWYDPRHCHNPNSEQWDRGNGRMYRMQYDATYEPANVDYTTATDEELVQAQLHPNEWHVRMARLVLSERATARDISAGAIDELTSMALRDPLPPRRLRAIWTLHGIGKLNGEIATLLLSDDSESIRAWIVQLALEFVDHVSDSGKPQAAAISRTALHHALVENAQHEKSLFVRRYLASAIQRVPAGVGWKIAEALCSRADSVTDRDLPLLVWYGVAPLVLQDLNRAFALADSSKIPAIHDYIYWYAARNSAQARETITGLLLPRAGEERLPDLELVALAVRDLRGLATPQSWSKLSVELYDSSVPGIRDAGESVGAAFGDAALYERMRMRLAAADSGIQARRHAISVLASDSSPKNLPYLLGLLDTSDLVPQVIPALGRYNDKAVADQLLTRLPGLHGEDNSAAMEVLCGRVASANLVLDRIAEGALPKSQLTAYYARQMSSLSDENLNKRLVAEWGTFGQSSAELKAEIATLATAYKTAPLWAYNDGEGGAHFKKMCASCHLPGPQGQTLAPKLSGSVSKGIHYLVENVIDPNAVIGRDFQARIIVTTEGRVITGLIEKESDSSITVRTLTESVTVAKDEIEEIKTSPNSFMPEGLLKSLNDRERIELFKYLMAQ